MLYYYTCTADTTVQHLQLYCVVSFCKLNKLPNWSPIQGQYKFSERIFKNRTYLIPSLFNDHSGNLSINNKTGC